MTKKIWRKLARRITVVEVDSTGATTSTELYRRKRRKKKKRSPSAQPLERLVRQQADAMASLAQMSATRRGRGREGWIRNFALNILRANDNGV